MMTGWHPHSSTLPSSDSPAAPSLPPPHQELSSKRHAPPGRKPCSPTSRSSHCFGQLLGQQLSPRPADCRLLGLDPGRKQHLKPSGTNRPDDVGHVSRIVERLDRDGLTWRVWELVTGAIAPYVPICAVSPATKVVIMYRFSGRLLSVGRDLVQAPSV